MGSILLVGRLVGAHLEAVFFQELGDFLVFVGDGNFGEVAEHGGPDLVGKLGAGVDLLLLGLELLLLGLNGELAGLDFVLLVLEFPLGALVAPSSNEEPKTQDNGESCRCGGYERKWHAIIEIEW